MCGIFGIVKKKESAVTNKQLQSVSDELLRYSVARGKESSGVAVYREGQIDVTKIPHESTELLKHSTYKKCFRDSAPIKAVIGHARLVTNGDERNVHNNQPVITADIVGVHNGIIVNDAALWKTHHDLQRSYEVDTEVLLAIVRKYISSGQSTSQALRSALGDIEGTVSTALLFADSQNVLLATNNGSLYLVDQGEVIVFASERSFLERLIAAHAWLQYEPSSITRLTVGEVVTIDMLSGQTVSQDAPVTTTKEAWPTAKIEDHSPQEILGATPAVVTDAVFMTEVYREYINNRDRVAQLKRCQQCILPETMPFIAFDEAGVCNYCRHYKKNTLHGVQSLHDLADSIRSDDGTPDCVVTFSGGRDSSYGLHYLVQELNLHPITYSYDWGMVTDIARRNQARMCGALGLENIVVSADIRKKRANIRKNVSAWLQKPSMGMIPLFMAGDKQFFYYANKVQQQTRVPKIVLSINPLERTDFKSGFCGVAPNFAKRGELFYRLSGGQGATMFGFYAKQFLTNPRYLNTSLIDTAFAFASYYMITHDYLHLYDYIEWDEATVDDVLINQYQWEIADDSKTTWRIGDGTAAFYNYIYYTVAGFTENDTFRSNQIREGQLRREDALARSVSENEPRFESFVWYCNTIGIDYKKALQTIHQIQKLYPA